MEVKDFAGAVVVSNEEDDGSGERRWWFDRTDEGLLVFAAEVLEYTEDFSGLVEDGGRHYVDECEMEISEGVIDALDSEGFELPPVDLHGREL